MFRDETVKVEKRVRASWGVAEASSSAPSLSTNNTRKITTVKTKRPIASTATSATLSIPSPPDSVSYPSPISTRSPHRTRDGSSPVTPSTSQSDELLQDSGWDLLALSPPIDTNPTDLGVSFYVHHYILGYPDEARRGEDLSSELWFHNPASQATMAALGLAGLGNRNDDKKLQHLSKVKYGEALKCTNEALSDPLKNLDAAIRATIMLALFQVMASNNKVQGISPRDIR